MKRLLALLLLLPLLALGQVTTNPGVTGVFPGFGSAAGTAAQGNDSRFTAGTRCAILTTAAVTCADGSAPANNGTFTTPAGARRLVIREKGAGGGGAGGTAADATNGGTGVATTFNAIGAAGGIGGQKGQANGATPGLGGSGGAGTASFRLAGASGNPPAVLYLTATNVQIQSGNGGGTGGGQSGGNAGIANSGGGGAGGATGSLAFASASAGWVGGSGGEGEYVEYIINSPTAGQTFTYAVGTGGTAGGAGTGGSVGYAGGSGYIIVDVQY